MLRKKIFGRQRRRKMEKKMVEKIFRDRKIGENGGMEPRHQRLCKSAFQTYKRRRKKRELYLIVEKEKDNHILRRKLYFLSWRRKIERENLYFFTSSGDEIMVTRCQDLEIRIYRKISYGTYFPIHPTLKQCADTTQMNCKIVWNWMPSRA